MASPTRCTWVWATLVMDREVWRAAVHQVLKRRTQFSNWTELIKLAMWLLNHSVENHKYSGLRNHIPWQTVEFSNTGLSVHSHNMIWLLTLLPLFIVSPNLCLLFLFRILHCTCTPWILLIQQVLLLFGLFSCEILRAGTMVALLCAYHVGHTLQETS